MFSIVAVREICAAPRDATPRQAGSSSAAMRAHARARQRAAPHAARAAPSGLQAEPHGCMHSQQACASHAHAPGGCAPHLEARLAVLAQPVRVLHLQRLPPLLQRAVLRRKLVLADLFNNNGRCIGRIVHLRSSRGASSRCVSTPECRCAPSAQAASSAAAKPCCCSSRAAKPRLQEALHRPVEEPGGGGRGRGRERSRRGAAAGACVCHMVRRRTACQLCVSSSRSVGNAQRARAHRMRKTRMVRPCVIMQRLVLWLNLPAFMSRMRWSCVQREQPPRRQQHWCMHPATPVLL